MRVEFMHKILNISHSQIDNYILVICTFSLFDRQFVKLKAFFFYACFKYMFFKILEISKLAIIDLYQLNSQLLTAFLQPQVGVLDWCYWQGCQIGFLVRVLDRSHRQVKTVVIGINNCAKLVLTGWQDGLIQVGMLDGCSSRGVRLILIMIYIVKQLLILNITD